MKKFNELVAKTYMKVLGEDVNVPPPEAVQDGEPPKPTEQSVQNTPQQPPEDDPASKATINNNNITFFTKSMINAILNADKISEENKAKLAELQNGITADTAYKTLQEIIGLTSEENPDDLPQDGTEQ